MSGPFGGNSPWGDVPVFTWATRPAAASYPVGQPFFISDVGGFNGSTYSGSFWYSDGNLLKPVSGSVMLCQMNTQINSGAPGSGDQSLFQFVVKGGLLGANGHLRITSAFWQSAGSEVKAQRVVFGGTTIGNYSGSGSGTIHAQTMLRNKNSESSQFYVKAENFPSYLIGTSFATLALNTANDQTLDWRTSPGATADTTALYGCTVELLK